MAIIDQNTVKAKISNPASIYTVEMISIQKSLEYLAETETLQTKTLPYTLTHSTPFRVLKPFTQKKTTSTKYATQNPVRTELQTENKNEIKFIWISSNIRITGNENADKITKKAITPPMKNQPTNLTN